MEELPHLTTLEFKKWLESNPELPDCGFNCTSPWNSPLSKFLKLPIFVRDGAVWCEVDSTDPNKDLGDKVKYNLPDWAKRYELAVTKARVKSIADAIELLKEFETCK